MQVEYIGAADHKGFTAEDFARHGVEDQGDVAFTRDYPVQELSEAAYAFLSGDESGEKANFKVPSSQEDQNTDESPGDVAATVDPDGSAEPPTDDPVIPVDLGGDEPHPPVAVPESEDAPNPNAPTEEPDPEEQPAKAAPKKAARPKAS